MKLTYRQSKNIDDRRKQKLDPATEEAAEFSRALIGYDKAPSELVDYVKNNESLSTKEINNALTAANKRNAAERQRDLARIPPERSKQIDASFANARKMDRETRATREVENRKKIKTASEKLGKAIEGHKQRKTAAVEEAKSKKVSKKPMKKSKSKPLKKSTPTNNFYEPKPYKG